MLTGDQLRFSGGHLLQPLLPLPLEATCHQAVLGIDGAITAFGTIQQVQTADSRSPSRSHRRLECSEYP